MSKFLAADTGGTFTDIAVFDTKTHQISYGKTLTDYNNLVDGIFAGISQSEVEMPDVLTVKHGTTQVINDLLQQDGAKTALVVTKGYKYILEVRRGSCPVPFDFDYRRVPALVPPHMCFEVDERMDFEGKELKAVNVDEIKEIAAKLRAEEVEAVAVSFINAYANPEHEEAVCAILRDELPGVKIVSAVALSGEWYEYERTSNAVANAYVSPKCETYIGEMQERLHQYGCEGSFYMMASNGGVLSLHRTLHEPIALVESGPVGGCIGASEFSKVLGLDKLIAFDMGGTTAKCAFIEDGSFAVQPIYYVNGYEHGFPLRTSVLDIVEVGTGGGSIAAIDDYGRLSVGPRSAGSEPGPVAYGKGGTEPTVTDANLTLGNLSAETFMNGLVKIDTEGARKAILEKVGKPLGYEDEGEIDKVAQGIISIANTNMMAAIKAISVERGYDIRESPMMCFGGGGPLHATALARALNINTVIIPPYAGIFSAIGMLMADARVDEVRTLIHELDDEVAKSLEDQFKLMEKEIEKSLNEELKNVGEIEFHRNLDMKYHGQLHNVTVPVQVGDDAEAIRKSFLNVYKQAYGYGDPNGRLDILALRITVSARVQSLRVEDLRLPEDYGCDNPQPRSHRSIYYPQVGERRDAPVYARSDLRPGFTGIGPAIIEEYGTTTNIGVKETFRIGDYGEIWITCGGEQ